MKIAIITEGGRIVGATEILAAYDEKGRVHARLLAGPEQILHEVEAPDDIFPQREASQDDIARFVRWLNEWKPDVEALGAGRLSGKDAGIE